MLLVREGVVSARWSATRSITRHIRDMAMTESKVVALPDTAPVHLSEGFCPLCSCPLQPVPHPFCACCNVDFRREG